MHYIHAHITSDSREKFYNNGIICDRTSGNRRIRLSLNYLKRHKDEQFTNFQKIYIIYNHETIFFWGKS